MKSDPIVEEVHHIREQMWDDCGGTLDALVASLRATEAAHSHLIISRDQLQQINKDARQDASPRIKKPGSAR
jgi:hypothetical protein